MFSEDEFVNTEMVAGVNRAFSAGAISSSDESWGVAPGSPRRIRPVAD